MRTSVSRLYEGMFLLDSGLAASDWDGLLGTIKTILEKNGAEILSMRKWDERRLAYDIEKKSRGTYVLCYFNVDTAKVTSIERDVNLSERIMRMLVLRADKVTEEDMSRATPAMLSAQEKPAVTENVQKPVEDKPEQPQEVVSQPQQNDEAVL